MKKTVFKYGLYSLITAFLLFAAVLLLGSGLGNTNQELLTYSSMVLALSFVFFGMRFYRDNENNGVLIFGDAIKIGLLISLFASLGMALMDMFYTSIINPDWGTEYIENSLKSMEQSLSAEEFELKKTELLNQMENYSHPAILGAMMFVLTFIIGFIITIISTLILRTKNQ